MVTWQHELRTPRIPFPTPVPSSFISRCHCRLPLAPSSPTCAVVVPFSVSHRSPVLSSSSSSCPVIIVPCSVNIVPCSVSHRSPVLSSSSSSCPVIIVPCSAFVPLLCQSTSEKSSCSVSHRYCFCLPIISSAKGKR